MYEYTRITLDKSSPKGRNYLFFIQVSESNEMKIFSNIHHGIVLKEINSLSRRFFNFYKPKLLRNCQKRQKTLTINYSSRISKCKCPFMLLFNLCKSKIVMCIVYTFIFVLHIAHVHVQYLCKMHNAHACLHVHVLHLKKIGKALKFE